MKKYGLIFIAVMAGLLLIQCSERSNPVDITQPQGHFWSLFFESSSIYNDIMTDYWYRNILVYTPPGYDAGDTLKPIATGIDSIHPGDTLVYGDTTGGNAPDSVDIIPPDTFFVYGDTSWGTYYPVLYLLHGYGGDHTYYKGLYGLGQIMDEMILAGQIRPMIVVTPNATNNLGGSFYTNSPSFDGQSYGGKMQDFITEEVVHIVDSVFNTLPDRQHRAIAGHSMGGYGAIKLAMLRNDLFGSAASMSAPIAFWGSYPTDSSFAGFQAMFPAVFAENNFNPGDTAAFYSIHPGTGKRLTNFMFAMAVAFSPHDPANPDTSYGHRFTTNQFAGMLDLPFDADGNLAMPVWNLWMANDVAAIFANGGEGVFDSTALYIDAGDQDDLYLQYHAQALHQAADLFGVTHEYHIYPSMGNLYPADHTSLISDRVREVARFNDAYFHR